MSIAAFQSYGHYTIWSFITFTNIRLIIYMYAVSDCGISWSYFYFKYGSVDILSYLSLSLNYPTYLPYKGFSLPKCSLPNSCVFVFCKYFFFKINFFKYYFRKTISRINTVWIKLVLIWSKFLAYYISKPQHFLLACQGLIYWPFVAA